MTRATVAVPLRGRLPAGVATAVVVAVLAMLNVAGHLLPGALWFEPVVVVALVWFARCAGLSWSQLGLSRDRLWAGSRWGLVAIIAVAAAYLAGVLFPLTRSAFLDTRYHLAVSGALVSAFVIIPMGTILVEEIAFRSVLWGMLARQLATWRVLVASSVLFGLWHILPSLHFASANQGVGHAVRGVGGSATVVVVGATVAITAVGGAVAGVLRHRSGSVLASAGMHWATNALGVLFGLLAWRLAG
jgi:membrane protease YdiL (CAAX protease family)